MPISHSQPDIPFAPGQKVVVVGAGASGLAAAKLCTVAGAHTLLVERDPKALTEAVRQLAEESGFRIETGAHSADQFRGAAVVVLSPGVPQTKLEGVLKEAGSPPVMAELELASRFVSEPILAVTGTSGKTTTVSLAAAMLREVGMRVFLGGNIGTPLSEYVLAKEKADVLVLEVSSFQLMGCDTFRPRVAVLLNLSPNHLDYHADMGEYRQAKYRLFRNMDADDVIVAGKEVADAVAALGLAPRLVRVSGSERFPQARLLGAHNRFNLEVAFQAALPLGAEEAAAIQAGSEYPPLPHRLETVGEWNGVRYVNDSKCTTAESLRVALESMDRPVHLLAGGVFKGGDLPSLLPLIRDKVASIHLFGDSREVFTGAWQDAAPLDWSPSLEEAMAKAREAASSGEVILLAPATASFDLFANYRQRGEAFRAQAEKLQ